MYNYLHTSDNSSVLTSFNTITTKLNQQKIADPT